MVLAPTYVVAQAFLAGGVLVLGLAAIGWHRAEAGVVPKVFSIPAYLVAGNLAAAHAFVRAVRGRRDALWEPTRREVVEGGA